MYECIRTVVAGMTSQEKIVRQAVDKLKDMLEDNDPNIKYLALHALTFLLESHPRIVAEHKGNIFGCIDHEDTNIQYCAKIVRGLVTKKTLMEPPRTSWVRWVRRTRDSETSSCGLSSTSA